MSNNIFFVEKEFNRKTYYTPGDIIVEDINGEKTPYLVCNDNVLINLFTFHIVTFDINISNMERFCQIGKFIVTADIYIDNNNVFNLPGEVHPGDIINIFGSPCLVVNKAYPEYNSHHNIILSELSEGSVTGIDLNHYPVIGKFPKMTRFTLENL